MISSGINLVMTVIGFAVSTLFLVFVCTRLICAQIHLNSSRRSFPVASRSDLSILERGLHGIDPVVVASFPTKKFSDAFFSSREDAQCTACLEEYGEEDVLRILPYCGHSFHVKCIDVWLQQQSTCPICRTSLRDSPDKKRALCPTFSSAIQSRTGPHTIHFVTPSSVGPAPKHELPAEVAAGGNDDVSSNNKRVESPSSDPRTCTDQN